MEIDQKLIEKCRKLPIEERQVFICSYCLKSIYVYGYLSTFLVNKETNLIICVDCIEKNNL